MNNHGLTDQQRRFADGLLNGKSQREAYENAGYKARGASADANASRLLGNAKVQRYLAEKRAAASDRTDVTVDRIIRELAVLGFSNINHYVIDEDGHVTLAPGAPEESIRAVSSIKRRARTFTDDDGNTETTVDTEIRLWNKNDGLSQLGRIFGIDKAGAGTIDVGTWEEPEFLERVASGEDVYRVAADRLRYLAVQRS